MDNYIKMCDCAEIQDNRHPSIGSLFWEPKMVEFGLFVLSSEKVQYQSETPWREALLISLKDYRLMNLDHHAIWLPRQEDLQAMVRDKVGSFREMSFWFNQWLHSFGWQEHWLLSTSMEQLWLEFVMHELYHKCWTGTEWRLEDVSEKL